MASVDVRVGSGSGYLGRDSGFVRRPNDGVSLKHWLADPDDGALLHSTKRLEQISKSREDRTRQRLNQVSKQLEYHSKPLSLPLNQHEKDQIPHRPKKVKQKAPLSHYAVSLEPLAAFGIRPGAIDRTAQLSASIHQVFRDKPNLARGVIDEIKNLPKDQHELLLYGCPCAGRQGQRLSDEVDDASRYDDGRSFAEEQRSNSNGGASYEESEDKSNGSDDEASTVSYNTELVDGDSSRSNKTPRSGRSGTTAPPDKSSKRTTSGKTLNKRMKDKDGGDGDDDDGHGGRKKHKKAPDGKEPPSSKHWLCPYSFTCLDLPKSCRPPTKFDYFTDLLRHLERTHYRKPDAGGRRRDFQSLMSADTLKDVKDVAESLRKRCERNTEGWHEKSLHLFREVWKIIFPGTEFLFVSPFCEDLHTCSHQREAILASIYKARSKIARQNQAGGWEGRFDPSEEDNVQMMAQTMDIFANLNISPRTEKQKDTNGTSSSSAPDQVEPSDLQQDLVPSGLPTQLSLTAASHGANPLAPFSATPSESQQTNLGLSPLQLEQLASILTPRQLAAVYETLQSAGRQEPSAATSHQVWPELAQDTATTRELMAPDVASFLSQIGPGNYQLAPWPHPSPNWPFPANHSTALAPNVAQQFAPRSINNQLSALDFSNITGNATVGTQQILGLQEWTSPWTNYDDPNFNAFSFNNFNPQQDGN